MVHTFIQMNTLCSSQLKVLQCLEIKENLPPSFSVWLWTKTWKKGQKIKTSASIHQNLSFLHRPPHIQRERCEKSMQFLNYSAQKCAALVNKDGAGCPLFIHDTSQYIMNDINISILFSRSHGVNIVLQPSSQIRADCHILFGTTVPSSRQEWDCLLFPLSFIFQSSSHLLLSYTVYSSCFVSFFPTRPLFDTVGLS